MLFLPIVEMVMKTDKREIFYSLSPPGLFTNNIISVGITLSSIDTSTDRCSFEMCYLHKHRQPNLICQIQQKCS